MFLIIESNHQQSDDNQNSDNETIHKPETIASEPNNSFAIIETGGKQLKVAENDTIFIEKIPGNVNDEVIFSKVLLVNNQIGHPFVNNANVVGVIQKQGKQKKIIVYRHNAKSTHKRKYGHRQPYTRVLIEKINEKAGA